MKFQINSTNDKYLKLKMGIVPVLILSLGYVLLMPGDNSDTVSTSVNTQDDGTTTTLPPQISGDELSKGIGKHIPKISLAEMTAHDPFKMLAVFNPKIDTDSVQDNNHTGDRLTTDQCDEKSENAERLIQIKESLKLHVINGIFMSGNKKAALIDAKVYYEGDLLQEGVRVHRINARDIVLEINSEEYITL